MKKKIMCAILAGMLFLVGCGTGDGSMQSESQEKTVANESYVSPQNNGALQVCEGKLCDENGDPVQLKGVSTHGIARVENFLTQDMFEEMRNEWGVNLIRLAMYTQSMDGYTKSDYYKQKNTELMEKGVDLATKCDMYAIIDWHILDDKTPLKYVDQAEEFFDQMSKEYKDNVNVIYEICNEPNETEWADIKAYANQIIPVIRANDPDAVIICGTPEYSQRVDQALADPLDFDNVMYTLHFYAATHKDELRNRMIDCLDKGFPIFVTEYGITASDGKLPRDIEEANKWMEVMDQYQVSNCIWCLAKSGDACNLIQASSSKYCDFTEEDFTETGLWFVDMMSKYKEEHLGK